MELRRSHYCGKISESDIDSTAVAMGWVGTSRDMGGVIFIDLRDKTGVMQVVFDFQNYTDEEYLVIEKLRSEDVILVKGKIRERDEETYNPKIPTGTVELAAEELHVLSKADVLPFQIDDNLEVREDLRLKYRYLDLRRPKMFENFKKRNETVRSIRDYLESNDFLEVETPILTKSTPEGARDYLVPSRVHPGDFYALPQSPQIFKQLLMVSGFDRYYQVARCFRDEDLRADRQPEFTQVDIETSFMSKNEILEHLEKLFKKVFKDVLDIDIKEDFPRITYQEAMLKYGSDKPDIRFGLEIVDITELAGRTSFKVFTDAVKKGGIVRSINIKGGNKLTRSEIEELTEKAISFGAKGMAWLGINDDGSLRTILDKYISDDQMKELFEIMDVENGDFLIFSADTEDVVINTLGRLRLEIGDLLGLRKKDDYKFLMVVDFPLFEYSEEDERYVAMHHPFTMPVAEDLDTFDKDPASARAESYDVVLNGVELGSGSLRIYRPDIQQRMFRMLGLSEEEIEERFGFILEAFRFGTPPHGGFAFGLDRLVMLMLQENSIREVIAFPKNREAEDTMTEAPSTVRDEQLEELSLAVLGEDGSIRGSAMLENRVENKIDIEALCDLSELNLEHEEEYKAYIESMVRMTADFREKDFSEFDKTINIHPAKNAFRKDQVEQLLTREELLAHIDLDPSGHIVLPSVIEED